MGPEPRAGLTVRRAFDFSRPVTIDGAERQVTFRLATLATGLAEDDLPEIELIQHVTPELIWRQDFLRHPNGVIGTAKVALAVSDPMALAPLYAALLGEANVRRARGFLEILAPPGRIRYLSRCRLEAAFPGATEAAAGGRPGAIIFRIQNATVLRRTLADAGATARELSGGMLALEPSVSGTAGLLCFHA
jgi:hypothetical protein